MCHFDRPRDSGRNGIKAVAVCRDSSTSPSLACKSTSGDEDLVAEVGGAAAIVLTIWIADGDVASKRLGARNEVVCTAVEIGCEELVYQTCWKTLLCAICYCALVRSRCEGGVEIVYRSGIAGSRPEYSFPLD